jgi:cation diffusion facilitator CzcD-associated flavoprotein CzcO
MIPPRDLDILVVGAGQAGLAAAYYLRRSPVAWRVLDAGPAGGSWQHTWPSLRLFSPVQWSSLPGWRMPASAHEYPSRDELLAYLAAYERRYEIPVERPVRVDAVERQGERLRLRTSAGDWTARALIAATGSWSNPVVPDFAGADDFGGTILHSAAYPGPAPFAGQRVLVVGGGNSGAQIAADLGESADVAGVRWVTREPPVFLPPEVDGRYLFEQATARYRAVQEGRIPDPPRSLGDIVRVAPIARAFERGTLAAHPMFEQLIPGGARWADGAEWAADALILATGFRPALSLLAPLGIVEPSGRIAVDGTQSVAEPRVWLLGYGEWTGFASATIIGVGRSARASVDQVLRALAAPASGDRS